MKDFSYDSDASYINLSFNKQSYSFKIDTGAFTSLINKQEFKKIFDSKKLEDGEQIAMSAANDGNIIGYIHTVNFYIPEFNESRFLKVCFYDGTRLLLGMDAIRRNFEICFKKDNFSILLNQ